MGKYNVKNIMLGIGIGLVIASMANISRGSSELTVEEIKRQAEKHNLIVLSVEDIISKNEADEQKVAEPTAAPTEAPASEKITVNIVKGMTSEEITDLLLENGLITDKKSFTRRLAELKVDNRLRTGSFEIEKGASVDEIIKTLTQ